MQLETSTWSEVEDYLKTSRGMIIPIGAVEQHGPNGYIGTDFLCAEVVAKAAGAISGAMVAPTICYGMSQHHLAFAGSAALRPSTLLLVIRDIVNSFARNGFRQFFFVNGHGGNRNSVSAAFDELYAARSFGEAEGEVRCMVSYWAGPRSNALIDNFYGEAEGRHATASEVSLSQYYRPDHIKSVSMDPKVAPNHEKFFDATDYRMRHPDGRIGSNPSLSTPEAGRQLLQAASEDMAEAYLAFVNY